MQQVVCLGFVVNYPQDEGFYDPIVPIIKLRKRVSILSLNAFHQFQVGGFPRLQRWRRSLKRLRIFFDYQNLLDRIRSGYDASSNSANREAYREAMESEVLLLDDLGAHRGSDWVEDTITSIITWRCNHRKPLIATTNVPDADAGSAMIQRNDTLNKVEYRRTLGEQIGSRARSRLFEMCKVIKMPLIEDYRVRKARS